MESHYVYKSAYPIFLVSKILGLCGLNLDTTKGYTKSVWAWLWCFSLFILYLFCLVYYLSQSSTAVITKEQWMVETVTTLNTFTRVATLVLLTVTTLSTSQKVLV